MYALLTIAINFMLNHIYTPTDLVKAVYLNKWLALKGSHK